MFEIKFDRCFYWALAVLPLLIFAAKCNPDRIHGPADLVATFPWLGVGLGLTVSVLLLSMFAVSNRVDGVSEAVDDLKSRVKVERFRAVFVMAVSLLEDPTTERINTARDMLQNFLSELPDPPAIEPTEGE